MNSKIIILLICMFLISFGSAQKQNTNLNFSITSNFATSCQLTTMNTPNGIVTIGQTDTSSGTFDFYLLGGNFSSLGTYCMNIVCTDGVDSTTGQECIEVTSTGDISSNSQSGVIIAEGIFIALLLVIGFSFSKEKWKMRGLFFTMALLVGIIMIGSIRVVSGTSTTLTTLTESAFIIGIVITVFMIVYLLIYYTIEIFTKLKKKREMRWQVSSNPT